MQPSVYQHDDMSLGFEAELSSPWQIDDIPVFDGYYAALTITDHVREMIERHMTPQDYAEEVAYLWSEMADNYVPDDLIAQLADDLQAELDHLMSSAGLV